MNWDWIWGIFWTVGLSGFVALQVAGIAKDNPFSRHLRKWMGVAPQRWWRYITIPALWSFLEWFGIHITTPWL